MRCVHTDRCFICCRTVVCFRMTGWMVKNEWISLPSTILLSLFHFILFLTSFPSFDPLFLSLLSCFPHPFLFFHVHPSFFFLPPPCSIFWPFSSSLPHIFLFILFPPYFLLASLSFTRFLPSLLNPLLFFFIHPPIHPCIFQTPPYSFLLLPIIFASMHHFFSSLSSSSLV